MCNKMTFFFNKPNRKFSLSPPADCLQYFTGVSGKFKTYNYDGANTHLGNQQYSACIRKEAGFCCIKYFPCKDDENSFSLDSQDADNSIIESDCTQDYVRLEGKLFEYCIFCIP